MEPAPIGLDREGLTHRIVGLLGPRTQEDTRGLETRMDAAFDGTGPEDLRRLLERVRTTGDTWGYHPPDPLARRLSRAILDVLHAPGSTLHGAANLEPARHEPVVLLGNHLSFADVNDLEHLMVASGFGDVAERLTALVGPKVYLRPLRRLASLCFGTLKIPQSPSRATDEALMPRREVARIATRTIREARRRLEEGEHLVVFVEGTRSRSGSMQRGLAAVARYLGPPARLCIPFGIWGSEKLVPVEDEQMHSARVEARIGAPLRIDELFERCAGKRPLVVDAIGFRIAELLPPGYRGMYAEARRPLRRAYEIARTLGGAEA